MINFLSLIEILLLNMLKLLKIPGFWASIVKFYIFQVSRYFGNPEYRKIKFKKKVLISYKKSISFLYKILAIWIVASVKLTYI